jgi:hypothetical protein
MILEQTRLRLLEARTRFNKRTSKDLHVIITMDYEHEQINIYRSITLFLL